MRVGMMSGRVRWFAGALMMGALSLPVAAAANDRPERKRGGRAAEAPAAPAGPVASRGFLPAARAVEAALIAKDTATATSALAAAEAAVSTDGDRYLQTSFELQLALLTGDRAVQAAALDKLIAHPMMPAKDVGQFNFFSGQFAYNDGDYAKALQRLAVAQSAGYKNPALELMIVDSKLKSGDIDGGVTAAKTAIMASRAAGQVSPEDLYVRPAQALQRAGRRDELLDILSMRLQDYPNAPTWRNTLLVHLQFAGEDKDLGIDILRLMFVAGVMEQRSEFLEYAALATEAGLPGEVVKIIDSAWDNSKISRDDARFKEIRASQDERASGDRASMDADYRRALAEPNGRRVRAAADALFGMGDYARAAELFQSAADKGGADPNMVALRLAAALTMVGQYDEARAALDRVSGNRARLADLWRIHINAKTAAAAPAAPASTADTPAR